METLLPLFAVIWFVLPLFITAIICYKTGQNAGYMQASEERWDDIPEDEKPIDPSIN